MSRVMGRRLAILVGQAVGDALGAGTEFQTPSQIARKHGEVRTYVQGVNYGFKPGEFTDDTHMALCILGGYWDAYLRGADLLQATLLRFQGWYDAHPPDIGIATRGALAASRQHGLGGGFEEWERSGYASAGNGALMRAAASVVAGSRGDALRTEAIGLAMLTHPDPRSLAACVMLVAVLEALITGAEPADAWRSALAEIEQLPLDGPVAASLGAQKAGAVAGRLTKARATIRDAVEHGLTGTWRSQSGYVIDTLEAVVAASLAPSYLEGILPIVARGDDSDTVAAIAGAVLGARGLLPHDDLIDELRCDFVWPSWPPGEQRGWPTLAAFVPPRPGEDVPASGTLDDEAEALGYKIPVLRLFTFDQLGPGVFAGRAPTFRRDVWKLRASGITHVLDLREDHEWNGPGRRGGSAIEELDRLGISRLRVAITDMGAPRPGDLDLAVAYMETALHLGGTVYVHCRAGVQRTGAIVAAWYAGRESCSIDDAIAYLQLRRPDLEPMAYQVVAARTWLAQRPRP